jgi:hypothetical protein
MTKPFVAKHHESVFVDQCDKTMLPQHSHSERVSHRDTITSHASHTVFPKCQLTSKLNRRAVDTDRIPAIQLLG